MYLLYYLHIAISVIRYYFFKMLFLLQELANFIEGSTVGILAPDSSNVVALIKENYDVSLKTIAFTVC